LELDSRELGPLEYGNGSRFVHMADGGDSPTAFGGNGVGVDSVTEEAYAVDDGDAGITLDTVPVWHFSTPW
jgi:hypothetical protein